MSEDSLAFDSLLNLCQHQQRRIVLGILTEEQRSVTLDELTTAVLKYNHQTPITEASKAVFEEIRSSLHHVHLQMLASEGLIEYDPERQMVKTTEQFDQLHPTLATIFDLDPSLQMPMKL